METECQQQQVHWQHQDASNVEKTLRANGTPTAVGTTSTAEILATARFGFVGRKQHKSCRTDNSRNPELVEIPVEGVLTPLGMPAIAGMPTNSRGQNNSWGPKAAITSPTAESTVAAEQQGR